MSQYKKHTLIKAAQKGRVWEVVKMRQARKLGNKSYRQRTDEVPFSKEKVEKMGLQIESILLKNKNRITKEEKEKLIYAKMVILFRKNLCTWEELKKETKELEKYVTKEELLALSFWARGSRETKDKFIPEEDIDDLYEELENKLLELKKDSPSLCN